MVKLSSLIFIILFLLSCFTTSHATPVLLGKPMGLKDSKKHPNNISVFSTISYGYIPFIASYDGDTSLRKFEDGNTVKLEKTEYTQKDYQQEMTILNPMFGLQYAWKKLRFTLALGASDISLKQNNDDDSEEVASAMGANANTEGPSKFTEYDLNPGIAVSLGVDYEILKRKYISVVGGLHLAYMSSFGIEGSENDTKVTNNENDMVTTSKLTKIDITDVSLSLISVQPHLGLEWRPMRVFLSNTFGVFGNLVYSQADFTQEKASSNTNEVSKETVSFNVEPVQVFGVYYGWYVSSPNAGTFGIEAKLGTIMNLGLTYQYDF